MGDVALRRGRPQDCDALLAFWSIAGENDARPSDSSSALPRLLERDSEALIVAEIDGAIVGTVIAGWDGWRAHLYRLAVHPDRRRRGIGTLLLTEAEHHLAHLGATRFDAMVLQSNALGAAAWAARGYDSQEEWRRWVRPVDSSTARTSEPPGTESKSR